MTNSADPDQLALFAKTGHLVFSKRRVKKKKSLFTEGLTDHSVITLRGDLQKKKKKKKKWCSFYCLNCFSNLD